MKTIINVYGRIIISIICVAGFFILIKLFMDNSIMIYNTHTRDLNVENINTGYNYTISSIKSPYFEFDENKQYKYTMENENMEYISRNELLEGVIAKKSDGSLIDLNNVSVQVYKYELEYNDNGSLVYETVIARDSYGNILRDIDGTPIEIEQVKYQMKYLGFVPSGTETKEEIDNLTDNGISILDNGISMLSPGKYKVVYRIEDVNLKAEKSTIFIVEYPIS